MRTCQRNHEYDNEKHRTCPTCKVEYRKSYYAQNKDHERAITAAWIEKNREAYLQSKKDRKNKEDEQRWYQARLSKRPLDVIWRNVIARCTNPKNDHYHRYGGRGVTVCERWIGENGYDNFAADMGPRPSPKHSVERISNSGNYDPGNCKWATPKEQQRNRRVNALVTIEGKTQCIAAWCEEYGIGHTTFSGRLKHGWTGLSLLNKPNRKIRQKRNIP